MRLRVRTLFVTLSLIGFLTPHAVRADARYFEFNPDYKETLLVASSPQPVDQLFLPLNDHLNGFDIWVSNDNVAGTATFQVFDPQGSLIASIPRSIPAIANTTTGTRLKVALPSQVVTSAHQPHSFRIISSSPTLRMHHSVQQNVLAHDAEPQAAYTGGLARIGGQEQTFAFTFALYEDTEGTAPVLSNISATVVSVESVRIDLNASEPVDVTVQYGPQDQEQTYTASYTGQYTSCPIGLQPCSVLLPISDPGTPHTFTLTAQDAWGNTVQTTGTFTSAGISIDPTPTESPTPTPSATPDTVPPTITNEQALPTHNSVSVAWTTDEAATSFVVIRFGTNEITIGGNADSTLELEHLLQVGNLGQNTSYTAFIRSGDASGNETSTELEFTTSPAPPEEGASPTPSTSPTPEPTVTVTSDESGSSTAQWETPASGTPTQGYRVDIIGADGSLIRTIYTDDTHADLGAIPDGAHIIVYADNGDGTFRKVATPGRTDQSAPFLERLVTSLPIILASVGGAVIIGALLWMKLKKPRAPQKAPRPMPPEDQFVSHH